MKFWCFENEWDCPFNDNGECIHDNPLHNCEYFDKYYGKEKEDE